MQQMALKIEDQSFPPLVCAVKRKVPVTTQTVLRQRTAVFRCIGCSCATKQHRKVD